MICTVHMHNKRHQELLSVKLIEVCFPQKRNPRLSVKSTKQCWNITQHIYRHKTFRSGKLSVMEILMIVSSCAQNSSNTIILSTPCTVLTGQGSQYKLLRPGCPEGGPGPDYVTYVFIILSSIINFSIEQLDPFRPCPRHQLTVFLI